MAPIRHLLVMALFFGLMGGAGAAWAEDLKPIKLPSPQLEGGKPLMQALAARSSAREFGPEKLPEQTLSNLLWAAAGVNRPEIGKRTAPSAKNWQEIDVYVALPQGVYLYEPVKHELKLVAAQDLRALTGDQPFVKDAAASLVYVADYSRMQANDADRRFYSGADTGFISQNVYLFCASEGLSTVVRANINREALGKALKLRPEQTITLSQSVGYPRK